MKRMVAMFLFLVASGCSSAPVADFLDWVHPSPVRPQGACQPPHTTVPPTQPVPNPIVAPPEATPPIHSSGPPPVPLPGPATSAVYKPLPSSSGSERLPMPPLPE
jgi:hypothetical protein